MVTQTLRVRIHCETLPGIKKRVADAMSRLKIQGGDQRERPVDVDILTVPDIPTNHYVGKFLKLFFNCYANRCVLLRNQGIECFEK